MKEHSWEYGFILRYPNGSTDITGIIYEPWHFRYVGLEAAKEIYERDITLEEYLGARPVSEGEAVTYDYKPEKKQKQKHEAPVTNEESVPEEAPAINETPMPEETQAAVEGL